MNVEDIKAIELLEPWCLTKPGLESELAREVSSEHPLSGKRAIAVARRGDCDDVLFFLPDGPSPLAVVHLAWGSRREQSPQLPWTVFYSSLQDWIERCMKPDHASLQGE